jgi:hypothetical protein
MNFNAKQGAEEAEGTITTRLTERIIGAAIEVRRNTGVDQPLPIQVAQLLTYLRLSGKPIGLLINFNEAVLKKGLKRLVNHFRESGRAASSLGSLRAPIRGRAPLPIRPEHSETFAPRRLCDEIKMPRPTQYRIARNPQVPSAPSARQSGEDCKFQPFRSPLKPQRLSVSAVNI